ncbi:MAG: alanine acetyltransferase [Pseudonocardiales bacterium]|nr:MAG: alanine acetyltransferase [Pseudonocardiales bacterium]
MAARSHPGWPATLRSRNVELRPLRVRDGGAWSRLRIADQAWLSPWEPTSSVPWEQRHTPWAFQALRMRLQSQAREGSVLPFAVVYGDEIAGQLTVANVLRGVLRSGSVGYWIARRYAGRGVMPVAVALVVDHCFGRVGLHRIQVDIRPENTASRRVVEKLGFREEARYRRYLDIDGAYRDHVGYALTVEDCPEGLATRLADDAGR